MNEINFRRFFRRVYLEFYYMRYRLYHRRSYLDLQKKRKIATDSGYSLKPFDDKQCIFVHIPKCAGISVCKTLFGNLAGGHTTFNRYITIFEPKYIDNYFTFTIVRNPWDRLLSAFHFLKQGGMNKKDKVFSSKELIAYNEFDEFIKGWLTRENIWKHHHFKPQYHYVLDKRNKVSLKFIAFLENIEEDFAYIGNQLGITDTLPGLNRSQHKSYIDYYNPETKKIVEEVYAEDILLFGYNFDNSNLEKQIQARLNGKKFTLSDLA